MKYHSLWLAYGLFHVASAQEPSVVRDVPLPGYSGGTLHGSILTSGPTATQWVLACPTEYACVEYPFYAMNLTAGPSTFAATYGAYELAHDYYCSSESSSSMVEGGSPCYRGMYQQITGTKTVTCAADSSSWSCSFAFSGHTMLANKATGAPYTTSDNSSGAGALTEAGVINVLLTQIPATQVVTYVSGQAVATKTPGLESPATTGPAATNAAGSPSLEWARMAAVAGVGAAFAAVGGADVLAG